MKYFFFFHLNSDPPLNPSDIPQGEWICHACRNSSKKEIFIGKKRKRKSALEVLAFAASLVNPREFDLPRELQLPITFPGTDKADLIPNKRRRQQGVNNIGKEHNMLLIEESLNVVSVIALKPYSG